MDEAGLFVVTVASEKGGVGKTTIATNLAVYLKALREDLPVTIASFDNHFSIDHMFAIGGHRGRSVAGLFAGTAAGELTGLGEYGVQFLASERELQAPDDDPQHLRRALGRSGLRGILIFDTRPIIDYFTRNALLAADLVLVPVKDRPSLVNVASLLRVIREGEGDPARVWLLPSLIDARLRLRADIGVREFLTFAARERDYQVIDTWIAKSPKVEGLATGFSSRIHPVITHARGTAVHRQFRELADFVLQQHQDSPAGSRPHSLPEELPPGRRRRLQAECPLCRSARRRGEPDISSRICAAAASGSCIAPVWLPCLPGPRCHPRKRAGCWCSPSTEPVWPVRRATSGCTCSMLWGSVRPMPSRPAKNSPSPLFSRELRAAPPVNSSGKPFSFPIARRFRPGCWAGPAMPVSPACGEWCCAS